MLKSSETRNDDAIWIINPQIVSVCSEVWSADPPISFYYQILRIRGPVICTTHYLLCEYVCVLPNYNINQSATTTIPRVTSKHC